MNVGSLFSGIGGIDLGLERAGMRVAWQVEVDPYARAVLRKHWPDAAFYDDVRSVGAANLAPVDLVCGGFPCQDISNAGKRVGIEGERSGLWSEYARIVRELRPRYVLVENVAALLARGLQRVVGDLAACGYDAEWDCFPASAFGAPHQRDRLFILAYAVRGWGRGAEPREQPNARTYIAGSSSARDVADAKRVRELQPQGRVQDERRRIRDGGAAALADPAIDGRKQGRQTAQSGLELAGDGGDPLANADCVLRGHGHNGAVQDSRVEATGDARRRDAIRHADHWDVEPDVGRVAHGVPSRVDRLRCLGNAVVPQVAEWIGRQILAHAKEAVMRPRQLQLKGPEKDPGEAA